MTPSDVLARGHNLVIDCYTEKPTVNGNEDAESVMNLMLKKGILVLPVVDDHGDYLGSIQINTMLQKIWDITKQNVSINWVNVIDHGETDANKQRFSVELFHNTRNPVQAILSAVELLRSATGTFDTKMLRKFDRSERQIAGYADNQALLLPFREGAERLHMSAVARMEMTTRAPDRPGIAIQGRDEGRGSAIAPGHQIGQGLEVLRGEEDSVHLPRQRDEGPAGQAVEGHRGYLPGPDIHGQGDAHAGRA